MRPEVVLQMAKLIKCECGYIARGDTDDEVIGKIEMHIHDEHPDLVDKLSRDDIFGMIEQT
jgi:predicted small metal-binding protein